MNFKHAYLIIPILLITIPIGSQARNDKIDPPPIIVLPVPLPERLITLETKIEAQQVRDVMRVRLEAELLNRVSCIAVKSGTNDFYFEGCNVHVRNGAGQTDSLNGFGNLIVGYNEDKSVSPPSPKDRTGSHNLVVGRDHTYSSYGGFVAGENNSIEGRYASVSGGLRNSAIGSNSSVGGGGRTRP